MRNTILLAAAILLSISVSAQRHQQQRRSPSFMGWHLAKDVPVQIKRNELKLNLPTTIFLLHPEITYERIIHEDFGVGGSLGFNPGSDEYPIDFILAPFARWYFGGNALNLQKYGAGFFVELNGAVFAREDINTLSYGDNFEVSKSHAAAGLGLAFGWKYLSANNWTADVYFGAGRDFINESAYPRMGITIGKRF